MGFRFRKSFKVLPGVRINVSKKGISSVSLGGKGMTVNRNKKGTRITTGISGTGLSYSHYIAGNTKPSTAQHSDQAPTPRSNHSSSMLKGVAIGVFIMLILWWLF